jgi:hypothetical protein
MLPGGIMRKNTAKTPLALALATSGAYRVDPSRLIGWPDTVGGRLLMSRWRAEMERAGLRRAC